MIDGELDPGHLRQCPHCNSFVANLEAHQQDCVAMLIVSRYGTPISFPHPDIQSAARAACGFIETNQARPIQIILGDKVIWENTDPNGSGYKGLRKLAGAEWFKEHYE